ncbi:hypothetical protein CEXT_605101 [Caerostris extrusa]|uniref:Uncharacterized protein n=1 Tax=Caerostris extrusa TaxID=172846 RepID=A0AAV4UCR6_CAEEX|nr:hypothetical protein CEXT_605101 [Caerostris extrusa]
MLAHCHHSPHLWHCHILASLNPHATSLAMSYAQYSLPSFAHAGVLAANYTQAHSHNRPQQPPICHQPRLLLTTRPTCKILTGGLKCIVGE